MVRERRTLARMDNGVAATTPTSRAYRPAIPMAANGQMMIGGPVTR
jgi:hypothetical protein